MNTKRKNGHADLTDVTVLWTPKPKASSTTQKQQIAKKVEIKKVPFSYSPNTTGNSSTESLDVQPGAVNEKLQQQRSLANSLLQKTNTTDYSLPSRYLKASDTIDKTCGSPVISMGSDSTVNETDLLQTPVNTRAISPIIEENISFTPDDISTPRSSCASNTSHSPRMSINRISLPYVSTDLAELSQEIRNSDLSLQELCEQFCRRSSNFSQNFEFSKESFVPGELAGAKIAEHEESWRRELDILGGNSLRDYSLFSQIGQEEGISVTEFFRKKSELAELCLKDSPEKDRLPTPLIDKSLTYETLNSLEEPSFIQEIDKTAELGTRKVNESFDDSVLSITEIERVISSNDNTTKIMDYMFDKAALKKNENKRSVQKTSMSGKSSIFQNKDQNHSKENRGSNRNSHSDFKIQNSSVEPLKSCKNSCINRRTSSVEPLKSCKNSCINSRTCSVEPLKSCKNSCTNSRTSSVEPLKSCKNSCSKSRTSSVEPLKDSRNNLNDIKIRAPSREPVKHSRNNLSDIKTRASSVEPMKNSRNNLSDKSMSSLSSIRTASSLESLQGGKLPIETNRIELVWSCVPVGKRKIQSFILRNKSQNKLRFQLASSNTNCRILNDHSEADSVSVLPVLLYPAESRSFSVMFSPSAMGATVGKLNFSPISKELQLQQTKRQQLMMYGYGGYSKVDVLNVAKDTNMKMWLSLGKLDDTSQLSQKFIVRNTGTLTAFAYLTFGSKALYRYSKVTVYPTEVVLKPKEQIAVTVTYTLTKDDAKLMFAVTSNQVMEIGYVQIITGEEPLRGRIRRLCRKLKEEAGIVGDPLIESLSNKFPNEMMPVDLNKFCETVGCMKELMQSLVSREIILTLEKDCERSVMGQIDESSMFHSLAEDMPTIMQSMYPIASCTVEPTNMLLTPPVKTEDKIVLISHNSKPLQFQTSLAAVDVLQVTPCEGILSPGETVLLNVGCDFRKLQQPQQTFKLLIYVDDDLFEVNIKVVVVKSGFRK